MIEYKRQISVITIIAVSAVMFLGIICPMTEVGMVGVAHTDCSHVGTVLSSGENQMADCMNGKLGFLGSFLVSMPENILSLIALALVLVFVLKLRAIKDVYTSLLHRVRWRSLYLEYQNIVRVSFLRTFYYWLNVVTRPALVA